MAATRRCCRPPAVGASPARPALRRLRGASYLTRRPRVSAPPACRCWPACNRDAHAVNAARGPRRPRAPRQRCRPSGGPGRVPWGLTCQSAGFLKTRALPREALKITTRLHVLKSRNHDRQPVTLTCSESAARDSDRKCCGTTESGGLGLRKRYV